MSFIFCNATNSKIIDIVEDRKLNNLKNYFANFSLQTRKNVENIVIDIYSPYILLIRSMFPNASISLDRFHLSQLISRSFNMFRIKKMNQIKNEDTKMYNKMKRYWKLLLKNSLTLPYSNGRVEGNNRKIKVLKHTAYGYKNFSNFRNRILLMSNLVA